MGDSPYSDIRVLVPQHRRVAVDLWGRHLHLSIRASRQGVPHNPPAVVRSREGAAAPKSLGLWGTAMTVRRNVLEVIPAIATREPIISGTSGLRWHMVMDPAEIGRAHV